MGSSLVLRMFAVFGTGNMLCEDIPIFNVEFGVSCFRCYGLWLRPRV